MISALCKNDTIIGEISHYIRWLRWRRIVRRAFADGRAVACVHCGKLIVPGEIVAELTLGERSDEVGGALVHPGLGPHFTLENSKTAYCISGLPAIGEWNGMWVEKYEGLREPIISKINYCT